MSNRSGILAFASTLLLAASPAHAADVMLKLGANFANASYDNATRTFDEGTRNAWVGGAGLKLKVVKPFSIQIEGFYAQTGVTLSDATNGTTTLKLDYLQVPLTLRFDVPIPVVGIYVFAGPNLGIRLKSEQTGATNTIADSAKSTTWNFDVGAGVAVKVIPAMKILAEARATRGLSNALRADEGQTYKAQDFRILAGLEFGF